MFTAPLAYIGTTEIMIVAGIVVLLFGGTRLPQLAKGLGEGIREFKKSVDSDSDEPATKDGKPETDESAQAVAK